MRIVLVEDETIIAEYLKTILELSGNEVKVLFNGDLDFSTYLIKNKPDLVFLDINLESAKTGVDLAKDCEQLSIPFIYLTSYSDPLTISEAMKYDSIAYILKPFTEEEVFKTLEIAKIKMAKIAPKYLLVKDGYESIRLKFDQILWLKADNIYTEIKTDTKKILQRVPLSEMMHSLPEDQFFRVHRSFIINTNKVERVGADHIEIAGEHIPLSRSRKVEILEKLLFS